ncbi:PepSY-associated TM helix domain-containing protein [Flammeovirgaceae bacterium SG7u.111]|nr:PepSY-associated TM helix domain-containing protein [Flammeovirgaceae bacterium SG7u.132]WPO34887.1 PepSY-associated TM helix domain-containing protein [Flammeovirgaceae bacterium SG7u.111]
MSVSHLWLGLLSSIVVFLACLSGSIYAFRTQIENIVNYENVYLPVKNEGRIDIDASLHDFNKRFGGATSIQLFSELNKSIIISSLSPNGPGVTAYYNPYTGEYLSTQNRACKQFFDLVLNLHRFLLAGDVGKLINGTGILIFVYMLFSGLILWFPKKLKQLKQRLTIRWRARFYRLNYDLHSVLGFYTLLLLLVISLTGLYVSFHWMKNLMIVGLGGNSIVISEGNTALKEELSNAFSDLLNNLEDEQKSITDSSWTLQAALDETNQTFQERGEITIRLATEFSKNTRIIKMNNDNFFGLHIPQTVDFSSKGQVINVTRFSALSLHEQFKAIAKPLHTGEIMGLPSIILYFFVSLVGCSLPITGFIMWWRKIAKISAN